MSLWEYKVISSGKGGFVSPALMEKFLNDLGKDEWEIVSFHTQPDNLLAFTGLARRSTQRDWTLQDAAAAAAKIEADKLRLEFEAKFKGASAAASAAAEEKHESALAEKAAPEDGFRRLVDTSRDDDPDAPDEEKDEWDKLTASEEEELPTFFEAIRPHLRRNQRGPGMSVGTDYLAKKWDQSEEDLKGALLECGFVLPENEDSKPVYVEYDGDLFWLNINRRGELWLNTKEKPRPVFRAVQAQRVTVDEPVDGTPPPDGAAVAKPTFEPRARRDSAAPVAVAEPRPAAPVVAASSAPSGALPGGSELLAKIRPLMRRNRRGPGGSGSASFLSRALKCSEAELLAAFATLGLTTSAPGAKTQLVELDGDLWWMNQDSRGGVWINGREKLDGETVESAGAAADAAKEQAGAATGATSDSQSGEPSGAPQAVAADGTAPIAAAAPSLFGKLGAETVLPPADTTPEGAVPGTATEDILTKARGLLQGTRTGSVAGKLERIASDMGRAAEELLQTLETRGLKVPEKPREKPVFVEKDGEIFWLNRNAKGELWINAKASKFAADGEVDGADGSDGAEEKKPGRRPSRAKKTAE